MITPYDCGQNLKGAFLDGGRAFFRTSWSIMRLNEPRQLSDPVQCWRIFGSGEGGCCTRGEDCRKHRSHCRGNGMKGYIGLESNNIWGRLFFFLDVLPLYLIVVFSKYPLVITKWRFLVNSTESVILWFHLGAMSRMHYQPTSPLTCAWEFLMGYKI